MMIADKETVKIGPRGMVTSAGAGCGIHRAQLLARPIHLPTLAQVVSKHRDSISPARHLRVM